MGFEHQSDSGYSPDEEIGFETDDIDLDSGNLPEARTVAAPKHSARERINVRHGMNRDRLGRRSYDQNGDDDMGSGADMIAPDRPVRVSGAGKMSGVRTQRVVSEKSLFGDYLFTEDEPVDQHMSSERSGVLDALAYDEKRDGDGEQYESIFSAPPQSMVKRREGRRTSQVSARAARKSSGEEAAAETAEESDTPRARGSERKSRFSQRSSRSRSREAEEQQASAAPALPERTPIDEHDYERDRERDYAPRGEGGDYRERAPYGEYPERAPYGEYPERAPYGEYPERPPYEGEPYPPYGAYPGYPSAPYPPYGGYQGYPTAPYPPYGGYPMPYQNPYMQPQYVAYPQGVPVAGQPIYPAGTAPVIMPVMPGGFVYQPGSAPNEDSVQQAATPAPPTEGAASPPAEQHTAEPPQAKAAAAAAEPVQDSVAPPVAERQAAEKPAPAAEQPAVQSAPQQPSASGSGRFRKRGTAADAAGTAEMQQPRMSDSAEATPTESGRGSGETGRFRRRGGAAAEQTAQPTVSEAAAIPTAGAAPAQASGRFNRRGGAQSGEAAASALAADNAPGFAPRRNAPLDAEALSQPTDYADTAEAPRSSGRFNRRR